MPQRIKRTSGAEVIIRELMSLDLESERNIEEIGSGSRTETRSGRKFKKRNGNRRRPVKISMKVHTPRPCVSCTISSDEDDYIEELQRRRRRWMVNGFNEGYVYGAVNSKDRGSSNNCDSRILIWSGGCDRLPVASSGITWVAVHGEDMICVVTKRNQHLDKARLRGDFLKMEEECILKGFMTTEAHEMEDPSSKLRRRLKRVLKIRCTKKRDLKMTPFAAVSVSLSIDGAEEENGHEGSIPWPDLDVTINSLKEKLKTYPALTHDKTVQTAISTLEYLHQQDFHAGNILVDILMKGEQADMRLPPKEINKHLAVVHGEPRV